MIGAGGQMACTLPLRAHARPTPLRLALTPLSPPLLYVSLCPILSVGQTRYTKEHEWVRVTKEGEATIGITDFAQVSRTVRPRRQ